GGEADALPVARAPASVVAPRTALECVLEEIFARPRIADEQPTVEPRLRLLIVFRRDRTGFVTQEQRSRNTVSCGSNVVAAHSLLRVRPGHLADHIADVVETRRIGFAQSPYVLVLDHQPLAVAPELGHQRYGAGVNEAPHLGPDDPQVVVRGAGRHNAARLSGQEEPDGDETGTEVLAQFVSGDHVAFV